ncbi:MAG: S1 RNA-binding domain-containing protein [Bdellovibrionales bacterium]
MSKKKPASVFEDEPTGNKSHEFASLFEKSLGHSLKKLKVGDSLRAEILTIGKDESFVSTGTPHDAALLNIDLLDDKKQLKYKVGDIIDVVVVKVKGDEIRVTRKGAKSAPVEMENLEDAHDMELPVEGKVTEVVNGGYRVSLQGQSAFCPISQMDVRPVLDPSALIGKKFEFIITQFDAKKRNIVVSRRKFLDLRKAENEGEWLTQHKVGDLLDGVVTRVEQFGAFVDLGGGVEGLVHISEIGFSRLKHASEGARIGETVQVKLLKVDEEDTRLKISLSIKQAGGIGDPWMQVPQKYPVGTIVDAYVDKKESFGLFVVVAPGINGLLPKSKWRDSEDVKSFENKRPGDPIKVRVDEVRFEERRMTLGLPGEAQDDSWKEHQGANAGFGAMAAAFSKLKK